MDAITPRSPAPRLLLVYVLPALLLVAGSLGLTHSGADMALQRAFFTPSAETEWSYGEHPFWQVIYHLGTLPAMLAVLLALTGLFLKLRGMRMAQRNFRSIYLALVLAMGPGLIANAILKDHWGRPRPRDVIEFGGTHAYERPWQHDPSSRGKSFPCGHATMGFFFFAFYFIHRRHRPGMAWMAFTFAMVLGWVIGAARALQGGHFLTDTWWAMGLMWFTCTGCWHLVSWLERQPVAHAAAGTWRRYPIRTSLLLGTGALMAIGGALLATPYQHRESASFPNELFTKEARLVAYFEEGHLEFKDGGDASFRADGTGHGMVWSRVNTRIAHEVDAGQGELRIRQTRRGYFTELNQHLHCTLPYEPLAGCHVELRDTVVDLPLKNISHSQLWSFTGKGDIRLRVPESLQLRVRHRAGVTVRDESGWCVPSDGMLQKAGPSPLIKVDAFLAEGSVTVIGETDGDTGVAP